MYDFDKFLSRIVLLANAFFAWFIEFNIAIFFGFHLNPVKKRFALLWKLTLINIWALYR